MFNDDYYSLNVNAKVHLIFKKSKLFPKQKPTETKHVENILYFCTWK
jgi:hypothetical protein